MAINIDNNQYRQFIAFAEKNGQDTIARIDTECNIQLEGGARNISVKAGDPQDQYVPSLLGP